MFHGRRHMQIVLRYLTILASYSFGNVSRQSQAAKFWGRNSHVVSISIRARDLHDTLNSVFFKGDSAPKISPSHYCSLRLNSVTASEQTRMILCLYSIVSPSAKCVEKNRSIQVFESWMLDGWTWRLQTPQWLHNCISFYILFSCNYHFKDHNVYKMYHRCSNGEISIRCRDVKSVTSSRGDRTGGHSVQFHP